MYAYVHEHKYAHTHTHTFLPTYLHTYIHTYMYAYIHTSIHAYMHTSIPYNPYIHTYTHTHTHTYIYQFMYIAGAVLCAPGEQLQTAREGQYVHGGCGDENGVERYGRTSPCGIQECMSSGIQECMSKRSKCESPENRTRTVCNKPCPNGIL